jgi:hypothetical protein
MSVGSPITQGSAGDRFQLDRLAEELASREQGSSPNPATAAVSLPLSTTLSHTDPFLSASAFDIEAFLLSRAHTPLPDLRTELRDYGAALKEELVRLLNDDYAAFISLSTDLRGEGARLERLGYPLETLKGMVLVCAWCTAVCWLID